MDSVWRPLHYTVKDAPLAFCDFRSVDRQDLIRCDRISAQYAGENYQLKHNASQAWTYFSNQEPDEAAIFVSYDSNPGTDAECKATTHAIRRRRRVRLIMY